MRLLVTGSRDWEDRDGLEYQLHHHTLEVFEEIILVSGACPTGADWMAEQFATHMGWHLELHPADWDRYGKAAGYRRNAEMVNLGADLCLAFHRSHSRGTKHTINLAVAAGIRTIVLLHPVAKP